jgi:hypothetical protein
MLPIFPAGVGVLAKASVLERTCATAVAMRCALDNCGVKTLKFGITWFVTCHRRTSRFCAGGLFDKLA